MTIGDRLAPGGQVGPNTKPFPAARGIEAEAGTNLVDDQRGFRLVADATRRAREFEGGKLLF